ncbi:17-beta-hydroxysteroid dehydrogenase type 2-like isoform X2 [Polyodon spathula]|uniref:17-beta-hydroxysteroid dehydrogenase type 2-like isoform X2 n=1 Tax=Polyodon spathula TaxID=7913 RepID=UPI001B7E21FB|nr:17-beta-hydroxysteroid dehydrogenase type 2-like isoform X2 [Polyodon spathula]
MDSASVLYGAVTALYTAAVILQVIRGGLKLGLSWVFSLFLVFVGVPLCFIKLPGYSGLLLLSFGYLISHFVLARSEKLLLVGNKAVLITGLWGIVNNAGILEYIADGEILPMSIYKNCMAVNFFGAVKLSHTFLPLLRQAKGRLVNVSSMAGEVPIPGFAAYGASKAALNRFSSVMRQELSKWGVTVVTVQPGGFQTSIYGTEEQWNYRQEQILSQLCPDVKEDYSEQCIYLLHSILPKMPSGCSKDLQPVLDDIHHALMANSPRHLYTPGRGAWAIPFIYNYFPVAISDFVIKTIDPRTNQQGSRENTTLPTTSCNQHMNSSPGQNTT